MIVWMIYCVIAAALLAVAARASEWIARLVGVPVRWCWAAAMAMLVTLAVVAPLRRSNVVELPQIPGAIALRAEAIPLQSSIDAVSRGLPTSSVVVAAIGWGLATAAMLFVILAVHARLRRVRHVWPLAELHGARVRVAPDVGPVVIGFRLPEIVVPRWLLARTHEEQRLIVTHEAEHVRAKDTVLLGAGLITVALMPWNPFVWYMYSRLRLAVELDCDARVLRGGTTVESYGSLLIDVASQAVPMRFGVAAVANNTSHLHQRIVAMKHIVPRYARLRASVVGVFGAAALLAACEAKMPTAVDVDRMDVGLAEARLKPLMHRDGDSISVYLVDHVQVTKEQAHAINADDVASMEVVRAPGEQKKIIIATKAGVAREAPSDAVRLRAAGDTAVVTVIGKKMAAASRAAPVLIIDGVRSSPDVLETIDRTSIESVEIIKGRAVESLTIPGVTATELSAGLIKITTKRR